MSSNDKAIVIGRSRSVAGWGCRQLLLIGFLLPAVLGFLNEVRAQVLEVPSQSPLWTESPLSPARPSTFPQTPDRPADSSFQSQLERSQSGPGPMLGPGFSAVPSDACPECGQGWPDVGSHPDRPGERLERALQGWLDPPVRYRGPGQPLLRESWLYRPYSIGWFMGALHGGELVDDWVTQKQGYLGGFRLGWDFHHYWGCEMRLAWGYAQIVDSQRAKDAQTAADDLLGLAPDDPFRSRFDGRRDSNLSVVWDFSFLYYPWGDSAWRPYFLAGLGYASIRFEDRLSQSWSSGALGLPLGVGLKYRWNDWLVFRVELIDTLLVPSNGINRVNEISFNGGVEIRFGGPRKAYWHWTPGLHYW